ncbi:MAG: hypothetical protein JW743_03905 [Deltaproteobacteria bacterium]|jgi:hypothetical protein|nr:hypothetical protein [Deltaproteobacteria bacterium]MBN2845652.1 hypothetical protein [Deltaproteobacteria bacterium]
MAEDKGPSLYKLVIDRLKNGEITIDVDKSSSLRTYARLSENPFIKLLHTTVYIFSHPFTIIGVVIFLLVMGEFFFILYYAVGLTILLVLEDYLVKKVTLLSALKKKSVFDELYKNGVIKIKEIFDPHHPI